MPKGEFVFDGHGRMVAQLASYHAHAGQFDESDKLLREVRLLKARAEDTWTEAFKDWPGHAESYARLRDFYLSEADATNAASEGQLIQAEALYRNTLGNSVDYRLSLERSL